MFRFLGDSSFQVKNTTSVSSPKLPQISLPKLPGQSQGHANAIKFKTERVYSQSANQKPIR